MRNTVGSNPDVMQLGPPDAGPDRAGFELTLQVREIGERLSLDERDPAIHSRQGQQCEIASPE